MGTETEQVQEAVRLKGIAEAKFNDSNLKSAVKHAKKAHHLCPDLDGLSSMLTAFKILQLASKSPQSDITDWYKILQVEPFSHINTIKKQYKKLALILHPDKNPYLGCEDAFKLVGEGLRVLSDKIRRKEYDMKLRIRLQEERVNVNSVLETFWTACSRCRLLHQFERRYLGHNLVCPSCKKSFEAVEVEAGNKQKQAVQVSVRSESLRRRSFGNRKKVGSVDSGGKLNSENPEGSSEKTGNVSLKRKVGGQEGVGRVRSANLKGKEDERGEWGGGRLRTRGLIRKMSTVDDVLERSNLKKVKSGEEMMTLAELQLEARQKARQEKAKLKDRKKDIGNKDTVQEKGKLEGKEKEKEKENNEVSRSSNSELEKNGSSINSGDMETIAVKKSRNVVVEARKPSRKSVNFGAMRHKGSKNSDLEIMAMEDWNFYDFDRDRVERSFKKGQVWAVYDDGDGMPRHHGLIDEVVSLCPFEVRLSQLDLERNENERLIRWEKTGFYVSCGKFQVGRKIIVKNVNMFSHVVDCERAAREVYRIYPKKGSVWALYNEAAWGAEGRKLSARERRCYDIVVFLTTYSEVNGLSMAYLERVDGCNTVFKRQDVGYHAIKWLEKGDVRLLSHQIPARKLSGDDVPDLLRGCWELDVASLPPDLVTNGSGIDV